MHAAARSQERLEGVLEGGTVRGLLTGCRRLVPSGLGSDRAGLTSWGQALAGVTSVTPGETGFWESSSVLKGRAPFHSCSLPPAGRTEVGRCDAPSPGWHLHTDTTRGDAANLLGRQMGRASVLHGPRLSALSPPRGEAHAPSRQADLREERRELPQCHMPNPRRNFYPSVTLMPVPPCGSTRLERGGSPDHQCVPGRGSGEGAAVPLKFRWW